MKIAVIGAGNMGGALVRGWAGAENAPRIVVANPSAAKLEAIRSEYPDVDVTSDNRRAASDADVVVIAVKPWLVGGVIEQLRDILLTRTRMLVSVAAGIYPDALSSMISPDSPLRLPVFYAIPNTPVAVREGMVFYTAANASDSDVDSFDSLARMLGKAIMVTPSQMDAGMAVASCGIAYAMRYIRAAVEGGVELGLRPAQAQEAVIQTLRGAVALLEANGDHPEQEIDRVTTPGGYTIRGLNAMEESGFTAAVIRGLRASVSKKQ